MENISIVVYTMKGCFFCTKFKEMLSEEKIEFYDRDIDEYKEEYDLFSKVNDNDLIPALLIIEGDDENHKTFMYVPDKNYQDLSEALDIVKKHKNNATIL